MTEAMEELKALRARYQGAGKLREAKAISRAIEVLRAIRTGPTLDELPARRYGLWADLHDRKQTTQSSRRTA